ELLGDAYIRRLVLHAARKFDLDIDPADVTQESINAHREQLLIKRAGNRRMRVCHHCGVRFRQLRVKRIQKYCSNRCKWNAQQLVGPPKPYLKSCRRCKAQFANHRGPYCGACQTLNANEQKQHQETVRLWRANRTERVRQYRRESRHRDSLNLTDQYIRKCLTRNYGGPKIKSRDIPQALIEVKRLHLKLMRKLREITGN